MAEMYPPSAIRITDLGASGVRIEAQGAALDALYRAHLKAYGARDDATRDCFRAVVNRQPFIAEADANDFWALAAELKAAGMRKLAAELWWHDAHARAEVLREQAWDLELAANKIEAEALR